MQRLDGPPSLNVTKGCIHNAVFYVLTRSRSKQHGERRPTQRFFTNCSSSTEQFADTMYPASTPSTSIFSLYAMAEEPKGGASDSSVKEDYNYLAQRVLQQSPDIFWASTTAESLPSLRRLARKYLSIPATSASVERLFSVSGAMIRARRGSLAPNTVESLLLCMEQTK